MFCFVHPRLALRMAELAFAAFTEFSANARMGKSIATLLLLSTMRCVAGRFD
jgi:hypothetical protein